MKITLGEVGTYINGYAFKPSDWGTRGLPIIRIQNLTNQNTVPNYFDGPYNPKFEVNKGDILIAWSGSLGIHIWQKNRALLNQHIFRVKFNKCDIDKMYFYYAVKYNIHKMLHLTHGATMKHIIKSDFEQIVVPYPSLDVQAKISKILNYLEQNIINYRNILLKLELLIKSRFVEMFGLFNVNINNYKTIKLKDLIEQNKINKEETVWLLNLDMIKSNTGEIIEKVYINSQNTPTSSISFTKGTVLYSKLRPYLNKVVIADENGYGTSELIPLNSYKNGLTAEYLAYYLRQDSFVEYIKDKVTGAKMPRVSMDILRNIDIAQPNYISQEQFSSFVNQINKLKFAQIVYN